MLQLQEENYRNKIKSFFKKEIVGQVNALHWPIKKSNLATFIDVNKQ
jgi:hypothetical protein